MDNYTTNNGSYEADEGFCFCNKITGNICGGMTLTDGDSFDNYEVIERPPEPVYEEPTDEEVSDTDALNELLEVIDDEA